MNAAIQPKPPGAESLENLRRMARGAQAAADVRANGGLTEHIDALCAPKCSDIEGVVMWHYPIATYSTMRLIGPWVQSLLKHAAAIHEAAVQEAEASGRDAPQFSIPLEVMLMQVVAFAQPRDAYQYARRGEGPYLQHCFDWADQILSGDEQFRKLGRLYRFVLEQCGVLEAVNPQKPETNPSPEASHRTAAPGAAPAADSPEPCPESQPEAMPDLSPQ